MIMSIDHFSPDSGKSMKRSALRDILKYLQRPGMISFAGLLTPTETVPVNELKF
jgi:hypothetical protein